MSRVSPSRLPPPQPTPLRRRSLEGWASFRHAQARHSTIDGGSVTYLTLIDQRLTQFLWYLLHLAGFTSVTARIYTSGISLAMLPRFDSSGHRERKEERAGLPTSVRESPRTEVG